MSDVPVVFIHLGPYEWMTQVIDQAALYADVHLIADGYHRERPGYLPYQNYAKDLAAFEQVFVNLSSNPHSFEYACFARWFILMRWMEAQDRDVCFYLDSDVLLFADPEAEWHAKFSDFPLTLIHGTCAASSFITYDVLRSFCEYVLTIYTEKGDTFRSFMDTYAEMQRLGYAGGICDMTLWKFFCARFKINWAEMTVVSHDGSTYDHTMRSADGYDTIDEGGWRAKYIEFHNHQPYARQMPSRKMVRFNTLHLQGDHDRLIPEFVRRAVLDGMPLGQGRFGQPLKVP